MPMGVFVARPAIWDIFRENPYIHTSTFGTGEIRSFVTVVPEPATYGMMMLGLVGLGGILRRRRS